MAAVLYNILRFTGLSSGASVSSTHGLQDANAQALTPHDVLLNAGGFTVSVNATAITLTPGAAAPAAVDVEFWHRHSIEDAEPQPSGIATSVMPFIMQGGGGSGVGGGGIALSGGTQLAATGTVVFSNSNGYTFGLSGSSRMTISGDGFRSIVGPGSTATGPTISFANANNVTFGITGQTITASVQTAGGTATGVGISAGTEVATTGAVVFSNSNQISFGLNAQTLTASYAGIKSVSGGTTRATNGEVVFSNSNSVSFGVAGNTVTASFSTTPETPFGVSAGTQSVSTGTLVFSNSNGLTFGMSGSSRITGSYSQSTAPNAVAINAAGSVTAGTVVFSNSNNVTFGLNGSTITASASAVAETPFGVSAGTQSVSTGTLVFSNSNGVSFGMSGSSRITASVSDYTYSQFQNFLGASQVFSFPGNSTLQVQPANLPNLAISNVSAYAMFTAQSTGTMTFTEHVGLYTKNVSTLSLMHSSSFSFSLAYDSTLNDTLYNGLRAISGGWTTTFSKGDYFIGVLGMSTTSSQNASLSLGHVVGLVNGDLSGVMGQATNVSRQAVMGLGIFSAQTAALPASIAFSQIRGGSKGAGIGNDGAAYPMIAFGSTV